MTVLRWGWQIYLTQQVRMTGLPDTTGEDDRSNWHNRGGWPVSGEDDQSTWPAGEDNRSTWHSRLGSSVYLTQQVRMTGLPDTTGEDNRSTWHNRWWWPVCLTQQGRVTGLPDTKGEDNRSTWHSRWGWPAPTVAQCRSCSSTQDSNTSQLSTNKYWIFILIFLLNNYIVGWQIKWWTQMLEELGNVVKCTFAFCQLYVECVNKKHVFF